MSAITIRKLPPGVARAVRELARWERLSLNRAVIRLLEEATGQAGPRSKARVLHDDLDGFFGGWSRTDADAFDRALAEQREIEPEMWK